MNRILFSASALALTAGTALAQNPTLTAREAGGAHIKGDGVSLPAAICWYNGDLDNRNGFTSERTTLVADSWTFDDVNFPGGMVTGFKGHWMCSGGQQNSLSGADIIVYSGMSEGNFGTLIAQVNNVPVTVTPTGNFPFGHTEVRIDASLGGSSFNLAAGTYHVGLRVVGSAAVGQAWTCTTSGTNAVGTPPGNNGRTFLQSNFFGFPLPTDWQNLVGAGTWDVSYGLDCGGGGGFDITLSGPCPGQKTLSWTGAGSGQMGIIIGNSTGSTTIPTGPCQGTVLGIQGGITLYNIIGTQGGQGQVSAQVGGGACGKFVQCIKTNDCSLSDVAGPI
jgi:hypothetical protein